MLLFRRLFFFCVWLIWASWLQKEKTGLISSLPKLHAALQAVCVGSDAVERRFAPRELLLAAAHTLCAGSTAPLSTFPSQQWGWGQGQGWGWKEMDGDGDRDPPKAHQDAQHRCSLRTVCFPVLCARSALLLNDENSMKMLPQ